MPWPSPRSERSAKWRSTRRSRPLAPSRTTRRSASRAATGPAFAYVDDKVIETSVVTTWDAVRHQEPAFVVACDTSIDLSAGSHRIISDGDAAFSIDGVTLEPGKRKAAPPARTTCVDRWDTDARTIEVAAGDRSILATTENAVPGWVATYEGKELRPIVVDGWRQGWNCRRGGPAWSNSASSRESCTAASWRGAASCCSCSSCSTSTPCGTSCRRADRSAPPRAPSRLQHTSRRGDRRGGGGRRCRTRLPRRPGLVPGPACQRDDPRDRCVVDRGGVHGAAEPLGSTIAATGTFSPLAETAAAWPSEPSP